MAVKLTDVLQTMITDLGQWIRVGTDVEFTATGGGATTTINTGFANEEESPEEETFKNHYLFVTQDAAGAGASPEGRFAKVSAYAVTTHTLTHATVTDAVAVGDKFQVASQSIFPISAMIKAVNGGLAELGTFTFVDRSLTTVSAQTEYSLPAGVLEVLDVRIQGTTSDSNDNQYYPIGGWKIVYPTTTLSTEPLLYIPEMAAGYTIEIEYNGYHPTLSLYSDIVYKFVKKELVVAAAMVKLLKGFINEGGGQTDQHWRNMYAEALRLRDTMKMEIPSLRGKRRKIGLTWSFDGVEEDTFTYPSA